MSNKDKEDNRDYPIEEMLEDARKYIEKEDRVHPLGLRGAIIVFLHTEDRIDLADKVAGKPDHPDSCQLYLCSGLDSVQATGILEIAKLRVHMNHTMNAIRLAKEQE